MTTAAFPATIGAAFLALVFVRAIFHKLGGYVEFVGNVRDYRVLPEPLAPFGAAALITLECVTVCALLLPPTRAAGAMLAAALLGAYAAAIATNLARGRTTIDCGCGGGGHGISPLHVLRNTLLAAFAVPVLAHPSPVLTSGASLAAAGCALALWLAFLAFDQLLSNYTHAHATTYARF